MILGAKEKKVKISDIDIKNYVKFVLKEGANQEKRELLGCLKSEIIVNNKHVSLAVKKH